MKYDLFKNIAITDIPNQSDWDLKTFLLWSLYISFNQNINMLTAFFERFLKKRPTRPTGLAWHGGGGMYHWNFRDNWMRVVDTSQLATDLHGKLVFWYKPFFKYFLTTTTTSLIPTQLCAYAFWNRQHPVARTLAGYTGRTYNVCARISDSNPVLAH